MNATPAPLIEIKAVSKRFERRPDLAERAARLMRPGAGVRAVRALDQVDLAVREGEVVGLVGESGCGKSTLGRIVARALHPSEGERLWKGRPYAEYDNAHARRERLAVQMIFQDPSASLNPRMRIVDIVGEAPVVHGLVRRRDRDDYVAGLLQRVGLDPATMRRFPHQFSGGQRSRIGIARALAVDPRFLVCDEAVASLDVSVQAQVLNLFARLREELRLTYLFISHDLGVIRYLSDRVVVMYLGRVVESADASDLFAQPNHPYTRALVAELPRTDLRRREYVPIRGEIPSPMDPPAGCHFHPRCPHAFERCRREAPALRAVGSAHFSACHLNETHP
ncbi:MAG TPA: ABC transporter ATP-binding protein [Usitatibacter sp.]|jgi:peptide/nickel transport system ATP-binding protein|nr:ABC transporter ATP-binding protein [Usitatibacter sp.]